MRSFLRRRIIVIIVINVWFAWFDGLESTSFGVKVVHVDDVEVSL